MAEELSISQQIEKLNDPALEEMFKGGDSRLPEVLAHLAWINENDANLSPPNRASNRVIAQIIMQRLVISDN